MKILPRLLLLLLPFQPLCAERDSGPGRHADRWHDEEPRVILYSGDNYTGVALELAPRTEIMELSDVRFSDGRKAHDRISSVRIFGGLQVTLWLDPAFGGQKIELTESVPQLKRLPRAQIGKHNWDNCISSVRVGPGSPRQYERDRDSRDDDRGPGRDHGRRPPPDPEKMIERAFREILQRGPTGAELRTYRVRVVSENWDHDRLCVEVRSTREYRSREADRIIIRVYRELLDREPDADGWARARRKFVDDDWTEERLRDSIRRSDEYRRRQHRPASGREH